MGSALSSVRAQERKRTEQGLFNGYVAELEMHRPADRSLWLSQSKVGEPVRRRVRSDCLLVTLRGFAGLPYTLTSRYGEKLG